ncbi:DegT/DnrJ/EryC1/StrS family aminotransferase [Akkermansiaceae bacterium]|nr:DegT/DnrJ/EryC1/StrS family aminotransferase [Akkermansiaceae bacterium]
MRTKYNVPLMRNAFLNEESVRSDLAEFVLNANKFSMGEQCRKFELNFANWTGSKYAVLVNSGGSANLVMLQVLKNLGKINDGDKIGFTGLTWSTNIFPIIQHGFAPIPIDITPTLLNSSYDQVINSIEQNDLKCVFLTNVLGYSSDLPRIKEYCDTRKILLLEDNCESLGTILWDGSMTGSHGLMSSHSFFIAHHMSTIEGGMVITDDFEVYEALKMARANGWDRDLSEKTQKDLRNRHGIVDEFRSKYTFYDLGFNIRPTEITGFLGNHQLKFLTQNIQKRIENYDKIVGSCDTIKKLVKFDHSLHRVISNFAMVFLFEDSSTMRKKKEKFENNGIEIRPVIAGNMSKQPFYSKYNLPNVNLPNTEFVDKCGFYCGNYPDMTTEDLEIIIESLN